MMGPQTPHEMIESQRQDWNRVASGWEKWDSFFERNMAFINHRLVAEARLRAGQRVLDLGSGTGYPALLAAQVVGPAGSVVGIDLAESMLAVARRKAVDARMAHVTFRTGDVSVLPFEPNSFDAVISRFCLMFLPEIPKALSEVTRVLQPGSYLAAAVWAAPDKNPYLHIPMDVIKTFIDLPPPDPEAPGIFRLAKAGDLAGMLRTAQLTDIVDEEFSGDVRFLSAEEYYASLMDLAAPLQNLFARLTAIQRGEAKEQIVKAARQFERGREIVLPISVRIVVARTPA